MALELTSNRDTDRTQFMIGLGCREDNPADLGLVGPDAAAEATRTYVQAYYEALEGYRRRYEVVERYSALLNR